MKKLLLAVSVLLLSNPVLAGTSIEAKVIKVRVDSGGLGMIFFDQPLNGTSPDCINAAAYKNALSFDANTAGGKSILSVALSAKATGTTVAAHGKGTCANYGGAHVEDLSYMQNL